MTILRASLDDVKHNVTEWNNLHQLGLVGPWEKPGAVVWGIGNYLITLRKVDDTHCEMLWIPYRWQRPDSATVISSWSLLNSQSKEAGWTDVDMPMPGARMLIDEQLKNLQEGDGEVAQQARAILQQRANRANVTVEQAAAEFFETLAGAAPVRGQGEAGTRSKRRKGGPVPVPDETKIEIVKEWLAVEGKESQASFCARKGISDRGLRGWIDDLESRGLLPS